MVVDWERGRRLGAAARAGGGWTGVGGMKKCLPAHILADMHGRLAVCKFGARNFMRLKSTEKVYMIIIKKNNNKPNLVAMCLFFFCVHFRMAPFSRFNYVINMVYMTYMY